jgi:hypothetical protein
MAGIYNEKKPLVNQKTRTQNAPKTNENKPERAKFHPKTPSPNPIKNRIVAPLTQIKIINFLTKTLKAISIPDSLFDLTETIFLGQGRTLWLM